MNVPAPIHSLLARGEKIALLTCYDASFATLMADAGVDLLLVGDSLGMVLQGAGDTLGVSMDDMCYHTRCVAAGSRGIPIISDLPAGSDATPEIALANARALRDAGACMVKLEGAKPDVVRHLVAHDIAVCGHLGFTPQSVHALGGYKVQGRDAAGAQRIIDDAVALEHAGIGMLVLEMVPAALADRISRRLEVPVIGIGAGPHCDGQVLVLHDMLGAYPGKTPRFVRNFLAEQGTIQRALSAYVGAVKDGSFPAAGHGF